MATKKQGEQRDEKAKISVLEAKIAVLQSDVLAKAQQIDNQCRTITGLQESLKSSLLVAREVKQDYLELAESVGAAFTTAKRIIERHGIKRTTVVTQGIASRV